MRFYIMSPSMTDEFRFDFHCLWWTFGETDGAIRVRVRVVGTSMPRGT